MKYDSCLFEQRILFYLRGTGGPSRVFTSYRSTRNVVSTILKYITRRSPIVSIIPT